LSLRNGRTIAYAISAQKIREKISTNKNQSLLSAPMRRIAAETQKKQLGDKYHESRNRQVRQTPRH